MIESPYDEASINRLQVAIQNVFDDEMKRHDQSAFEAFMTIMKMTLVLNELIKDVTGNVITLIPVAVPETPPTQPKETPA